MRCQRSSLLTTGIPACLWFLTREKTGKNLKHGGRDRTGETLFIDARKLGTMRPVRCAYSPAATTAKA